MKLTTLTSLIAYPCLALTFAANAQFTAGDIVVDQVGNGTSIGSTGTPFSIVEFAPAGGAAQLTVSIPSSGSTALITGGSAFDSDLSLSADGQSIVFGGYNFTPPSGSSIDSSSSSTVPRGVGSVNYLGVYSFGLSTTQLSAQTVRGVVSDGNNNFWAMGSTAGTVYLGSGSPGATIQSTAAAGRNMLFVNGSIYYSTTSGTASIQKLTGAPTTASTPSIVINTTGNNANPAAFAFNPSMTLAYVADSTAKTVGKYSFNGTSWVFDYNIITPAVTQNIAVDFSGANPIIYGTTGALLIDTVDTGTTTPTWSTLETAPSGDAFRGISFAPTLAPEPSTFAVLGLGAATCAFLRRRKKA